MLLVVLLHSTKISSFIALFSRAGMEFHVKTTIFKVVPVMDGQSLSLSTNLMLKPSYGPTCGPLTEYLWRHRPTLLIVGRMTGTSILVARPLTLLKLK